jgi:hypothetical protein
MSVPVEIRVRNGITVGGRGAVLIAFVQSGVPRAGQQTPPLDFGDGRVRRLEIAVIQRLASADAGRSAVGLVFRNAPSLSALERALPSGTVITLEDAPASDGPAS